VARSWKCRLVPSATDETQQRQFAIQGVPFFASSDHARGVFDAMKPVAPQASATMAAEATVAEPSAAGSTGGGGGGGGGSSNPLPDSGAGGGLLLGGSRQLSKFQRIEGLSLAASRQVSASQPIGGNTEVDAVSWACDSEWSAFPRPKVAMVGGWGAPGTHLLSQRHMRMVSSFGEVLDAHEPLNLQVTPATRNPKPSTPVTPNPQPPTPNSQPPTPNPPQS